jgi:hypothetical protein
LKDSDDKKTDEEKLSRHLLRKIAAVLLFALIVVVLIDGYFSDWSLIRTLVALNTLELRDRADRPWELTERRDFQLVKIGDVRAIVDTDSLLQFDQPYRDSGYYRLYFRSSDSSSMKLEKMYQVLLSYDTAQTIKHTVEDARRAYQNLQRILHPGGPVVRDTATSTRKDSATKYSLSGVSSSGGDEAMAVARKIVSDPRVLAGAGIGIVASAGIELLRGSAFVAISKQDVFRLDSLKVGSRVGKWEGLPIDILWVFAKKEQ